MTIYSYDFTTGTAGTSPLPNPPDINSEFLYEAVAGSVYAVPLSSLQPSCLLASPSDGTEVNEIKGTFRWLSAASALTSGNLANFLVTDTSLVSVFYIASLTTTGATGGHQVSVQVGQSGAILGQINADQDYTFDIHISGSTVTGTIAGFTLPTQTLGFTPTIGILQPISSSGSPSQWNMATKSMAVATGSSSLSGTPALALADLDLEFAPIWNTQALAAAGLSALDLESAALVSTALGVPSAGVARLLLTMTNDSSVYPASAGRAHLEFGSPVTSYLFEGWGMVGI